MKGRGQLDLKELKDELARKTNLVRAGDEFSTREILEKELSLIRTVNAGLYQAQPFALDYKPPQFLSNDQREALAHVLTSIDVFTGFRGLAGSGKSTALTELSNALTERGYEPVFCAPTSSAVQELQKNLPEPMTLAKFLSDPVAQKRLSARSVFVLDEAGAVGLNDMAALFEATQLARCRVVLCGDTGQHASVARGDALRIIEQYSGYRFSELTTIRRQKPEAFRKIVELAAAKKTEEAFAKLLELGVVTESTTDHGELYRRAADAYVTSTKEGKSALLVSPTWTEIEAVTGTVRDKMKAQGVLGQKDESVTVFDSLSWTEAQKKDTSQYAPGQRLRFIRRTRQFERGDTVEVRTVFPNGLRVRRSNGEEVDFHTDTASVCFDVGEARELKVAAGDWLLLQANRGKEFINGERVQVREIQNGRISLTDGRLLPADYNTFTHGYAVTSHSSQGKTVDEVLLVVSSKSFGAVNREQFYVSISRGRQAIHVFTDDAELLARRVTDTHERKAAIELEGLRTELANLGFVRRDQTQTGNPVLSVKQPFRMSRLLRGNSRVMRLTRLAPVQRLARRVQEIRRWIDKFITRARLVENEVREIKSIPTEQISKPESRHRTLRKQLQESIEKRRQQQGHSRGIKT